MFSGIYHADYNFGTNIKIAIQSLEICRASSDIEYICFNLLRPSDAYICQ